MEPTLLERCVSCDCASPVSTENLVMHGLLPVITGVAVWTITRSTANALLAAGGMEAATLAYRAFHNVEFTAIDTTSMPFKVFASIAAFVTVGVLAGYVTESPDFGFISGLVTAVGCAIAFYPDDRQTPSPQPGPPKNNGRRRDPPPPPPRRGGGRDPFNFGGSGGSGGADKEVTALQQKAKELQEKIRKDIDEGTIDQWRGDYEQDLGELKEEAKAYHKDDRLRELINVIQVTLSSSKDAGKQSQVSEAVKQDQALVEKLRQNYHILELPADGNCFFHCLVATQDKFYTLVGKILERLQKMRLDLNNDLEKEDLEGFGFRIGQGVFREGDAVKLQKMAPCVEAEMEFRRNVLPKLQEMRDDLKEQAAFMRKHGAKEVLTEMGKHNGKVLPLLTAGEQRALLAVVEANLTEAENEVKQGLEGALKQLDTWIGQLRSIEENDSAPIGEWWKLARNRLVEPQMIRMRWRIRDFLMQKGEHDKWVTEKIPTHMVVLLSEVDELKGTKPAGMSKFVFEELKKHVGEENWHATRAARDVWLEGLTHWNHTDESANWGEAITAQAAGEMLEKLLTIHSVERTEPYGGGEKLHFHKSPDHYNLLIPRETE